MVSASLAVSTSVAVPATVAVAKKGDGTSIAETSRIPFFGPKLYQFNPDGPDSSLF